MGKERILLESIRIKNGLVRNVEYHTRRMNRSRRELFGITAPLDILSLIQIPPGRGIFKCRILYNEFIREVHVLPYRPGLIRSLKMVTDDGIDYRYKYADRSRLEHLLSLKQDCDDILIVKNGCITDTSYANIVFQSPDGSWVTPDTPLLEGTMRQSLLDSGVITEKKIPVADLGNYVQARLINCMLNLESGPVIHITDIKC